MGRNAYRQRDVECGDCGWRGTRKTVDKPCPKCGGAVRGGVLLGGAVHGGWLRARVYGLPQGDQHLRQTMKPKSKTLGPRRKGQTFHNDVMKGEANVRPGGLGPGKRPKRRANAMPSGGGGGGWKKMNEDMARNRRKLQAGLTLGAMNQQYTGKGGDLPSGVTQRRVREQTASLESGLTLGTTIHPYDGTDPDTEASASGTSIFDPVLCEIAYRWFCPPDGTVLDPFAGGSVRGVVANRLGRRYIGIELREEQIAANIAQLNLCIGPGPAPDWREGDAYELDKLVSEDVDFIFTCPPFWNLEVYSEDQRDLSTMTLENFLHAQARIIELAAARLQEDRFAVWVTSDVRDSTGLYIDLPGKTIEAFEAIGLRLYNHAILVTAAGSLPIRVRRQFEVSRKLGRTHQHVLCFIKGDPRKATEAVGTAEFGEGFELALPLAPAPAADVAALGGEV